MSLEARGSSSSQSNIKPNHRGRMIKDCTPRTNSLEPLGRGPQPPVGRRGSGNSDIIADGNGLNKPDGLKRRIHELEKENNKLRLNLDEALVAVSTYRNFLAAKSSISNVCMATQTDCSGELRERKDINTDLRAENASLRTHVTSLQHSLADMSSRLDTCTKQKSEAEKAAAVKIDDLLAQIKYLTATKASPATSNRESNIPMLTELHRQTAEAREQHLLLQQKVENDLTTFRHHMHHTIELVANEVVRKQRVPVASPLKAAHTPSKAIKSPHHKQLHSLSMEAACSPMPSLATRQLTDRSTDPPSPAHVKGPDGGLDVMDTTVEQMMRSLEAATEKYETEKLLLEAQASKDASNVSTLTEKLIAASREFQNVLAKFGREIHAVKHLSHCRDLVRIAAMRELGLEKDRLANEVKHSKDTHNVLRFCLETAEQALLETQPHVVNKLTEARQRRMALLERDAAERKRDLEQRSSETCAVSTSHLETFQAKAERTVEMAAAECQDVVVSLQNLLGYRLPINKH